MGLLRGVYPEPEILRCPFAALRASAHQNDTRRRARKDIPRMTNQGEAAGHPRRSRRWYSYLLLLPVLRGVLEARAGF